MKRAVPAFLLFFSYAACDSYVAPPTADIVGLESGVLSDARMPLVVDFGKSVQPETVQAQVAFYETDVEGNLLDEDEDPDTNVHALATTPRLTNYDRVLVLDHEAALPVGPKLVLIVEAGLKGTDGTESHIRQKIPFSITVTCTAGKPTKLASGVFFVILDVQEPIGSQIQLYGAVDIDPASGALVAQFTNADRNPNLKCPAGCGSADVCRLLPAPECVAPSTRAGTVDEFSDFVPNPTPPTGYSFFVEGCAIDEGDATGVITAPATMVVESPPVTIEGLTMTASFTSDRATGSLVGESVRLGGKSRGAGKGTMTAIRLPDANVPPNVPRPPPKASADGGLDAGH